MHLGVRRVVGSVLPTVKSGLIYPPLAFKEFPSCENLVLSHVCVRDRSSLSACRCRLAVATSLTPRQSQIYLRHLCMCWSDIHTLKTWLLDHRMDSSSTSCIISEDLSQTVHTKTPNKSSSKTHRSPAGGKCYVCMQPGVCSVLLSWVYQGTCFWFNCLISQR